MIDNPIRDSVIRGIADPASIIATAVTAAASRPLQAGGNADRPAARRSRSPAVTPSA